MAEEKNRWIGLDTEAHNEKKKELISQQHRVVLLVQLQKTKQSRRRCTRHCENQREARCGCPQCVQKHHTPPPPLSLPPHPPPPPPLLPLLAAGGVRRGRACFTSTEDLVVDLTPKRHAFLSRSCASSLAALRLGGSPAPRRVARSPVVFRWIAAARKTGTWCTRWSSARRHQCAGAFDKSYYGRTLTGLGSYDATAPKEVQRGTRTPSEPTPCPQGVKLHVLSAPDVGAIATGRSCSPPLEGPSDEAIQLHGGRV